MSLDVGVSENSIFTYPFYIILTVILNVNLIMVNKFKNGRVIKSKQKVPTGAEANMLKWKELVCCLNCEEQRRLDEIKKMFVKNKFIKGDDKIGQVVLARGNISNI